MWVRDPKGGSFEGQIKDADSELIPLRITLQ